MSQLSSRQRFWGRLRRHLPRDLQSRLRGLQGLCHGGGSSDEK